MLITGTQMSKALDLDSPLPTPSGWTTMRDVRPGDELFDDTGATCRVTGVSSVMTDKPCHRVQFCDGSSLIASDDHLWRVEEFQHHRGALSRAQRTITTKDMIERGVRRHNGAARYSVPLCNPLQLLERDLPLSPYVLGVWIGDGNSRAPAISCGSRDLEALSALLRAEDMSLAQTRERTCWRIALSADGWNVRTRLREMGLIANKHIPLDYLRSSSSQRLALLQGLMDTDGTVISGAGSFCTKHEALARQVVELVASLGMRPRLSKHIASDGYQSWQVRFHAYRDQQIFRLERKQQRLKPRDAPKTRPWENQRRYIRGIEPVKTRPVRCIAVDSPSHLFLAGERMVPTHNTDAVLDVMGWRLATKPRPQLYVGPSKDFVTDQFEPRLMKLFDEAPVLAALVARGKRNKKVRKIVNAVSVRLAWAGSATSLASDQAGDVYIDEFDKMVGGVKGEGDVFTLAKARANTYADRKIVVTSTPKRGNVETEKDVKTGLEFWKMAEPADLESPIWAKWQQGTRHHFAWRCPQCSLWFIPRRSLLKCPKDATPTEARTSTWLECPNNGCVINEDAKKAMNAGGEFVAPGMAIDEGGRILEADLPDNSMLSLWVSGLASPFVGWGERVEQDLRAEFSGNSEERQGARNDVGEVWTPIGGDVPDWRAILNRAEPYLPGTVPDGVRYITIGIDVQRDRLVYVIRGWGERASSWLIEFGELLGETADTKVWRDLAEKLSTPIDGHLIKMAFVDSGFRPGKKIALPLNRVYQFCRRFRRFVYPTKGSSSSMLKPLVKSKPEVTQQGDIAKYGLELIRLDTDHWKSFVHERLTWPLDQAGAWHLHQAVNEHYCRQLVAEARIINDSGKPQWIERSKLNHYLDCEALAAAAAYMLNVQHLRPRPPRAARSEAAPASEPPAPPAPTTSETRPDETMTPPATSAPIVGRKLGRFARLAERLNK